MSNKLIKDNPIKAVIFDMDGVIFDSERIVIKCWEQIAREYNILDVGSVIHQCLGVNDTKTRAIFCEHYGKDFPYDEYRKLTSKMFHEQYDHGRLPMKEGVVELLCYLQENGYVIGLASSTRTEVVRKELEEAKILPYFDYLTCGDTVAKSKPEPDIYIKACENLGILPKEAIAIEDSYNGIRSAFRAGIFPVMVPDLIEADDEMKGLAGNICGNLLEVKAWLQNL
ncbi:MAG TPA: HAD family phosphatase [Lachnospiraceae bacterium]|nr:HAD family phosphatase [Lachnospiraceae bacterium]HPF29392.1 HAD family phosphatase [Lachnospiraceae bacterium]